MKRREQNGGGTCNFPRRLNLGCGSRLAPEWTNVDVRPRDLVLAHDLRRPLPFNSDVFDLVYHSHVLEHFRRKDVSPFLLECRRVLRPGGVIRVAVPDLEEIVRQYLSAMARVDSGEQGAGDDLEWMRLELYDQAVREQSGGAMGAVLRSPDVSNARFILRRMGLEADAMLSRRNQQADTRDNGELAPNLTPPPQPSRLRSKIRAFRSIARNGQFRETFLRRLLGTEYEALRIGRFRLAGEVHQWMYDRISLKNALEEVGFDWVVGRSATESYWDGWQDQNLDTEPEGTVYKPDSLYMEAINPT